MKMINTVFKEYAEKEFNADRNYEEILLKEKKKSSFLKKMLNTVATLLVIVVTGIMSTQIYAKIKWNIEFKEYQDRPNVEAKGTIEEAKENGYAEVINMDYITQDGISIKINSILLTDNCLDFDITFKFDDKINVDSKSFSFGYAIYDENSNIYNIQSRMHLDKKDDTINSFIYKELGLKYNAKNATALQLSDTATLRIKNVNEENRSININVTLKAKDRFPQSKDIYIKIFDPGFTMNNIENENNELVIKDSEDFKLSETKWSFEIEVPEKFYERNTIELVPKNEIPGLEVEQIQISETGMTIKFKSKEYDKVVKSGIDMEAENFQKQISEILSITDAEGNTYKVNSSGTTQEKYEYKLSIDVGINDFSKKLYINYNHNGTKYTEELIEK